MKERLSDPDGGAGVAAARLYFDGQDIPWQQRHPGRAGIEIPPEVLEADSLTPYAAETRYPGQLDDISRAEMTQALMLAAGTVAWARSLLDEG